MKNRNGTNTQTELALPLRPMQTSLILRPINLKSFADSAMEPWLRHLLDFTIAQYAEHKKARDRSLQRGEAWRSFKLLFAPCLAAPLGHAFMLLRFYREALSDTSLCNCLHRAFIPLTNEAEHTRGIIGPRTLVYFLLACGADPVRFPDLGAVSSLNPNGSVSLDALPVIIPGSHYFKARHSNLNDPPMLDLSSKFTLIRWCAWLDALFHLRVHRFYHEAPESCFNPDREIRYLAALGQGQRFFGYMDARAQFAWAQDFIHALLNYATTPKWDVFCKAVGGSAARTWAYPEIDSVVIAFWPLVQRFNWTYRDLLEVLRLPNSPLYLHNRIGRYPVSTVQEFAAHCRNIVGLRKRGKGKSTAMTLPKGHEIAVRLFPRRSAAR